MEGNSIRSAALLEYWKAILYGNALLEYWKSIINRLNAIDQIKLNDNDKINFSIFLDMINGRIDAIKFKDYQMPLNADSGFHTGLSRLHKAMPFKTESDYMNYISRLNQFPLFFDEHISNMKEGIKENRQARSRQGISEQWMWRLSVFGIRHVRKSAAD